MGVITDILECSEAQQVTCTGCDVTMKLYRDEDGWRCERCVPARRACKNQAQGCTHQDVAGKCTKHEQYFCEQSTRCCICREGIPRGTLSSHYASAHRDVTYSAGSTWLATVATGPCLFGQDCLVTCPAGTAVCGYRLDYFDLTLWVSIPVPSERLCEFRCEVRVTQPATGDTRTYTPDYFHTDGSDWNFQIGKEDFPIWNFEFDISVDISKI